MKRFTLTSMFLSLLVMSYPAFSQDAAETEKQLANLTYQLDVVNKDVKKMKNALASQAALTGLFQPYNVGALNLTSAVGGYKSKTAVAVGIGYRFTDAFAVKSGIATSKHGGGATYNVGVNYEFGH
ncbi:YadA C-terminal domain-containing protein [Bisgaard Taxon 45]